MLSVAVGGGLRTRVLEVFGPGQKRRSSAADQQVQEDLTQERPHQVVYRLTPSEKAEKLQDLGLLLSRLQETDSEKESDQYTVSSSPKEVLPKPPEAICSSSLQSAHDEEAAFRKKGKYKVKGYTVNLTETCDEEGLNLITDVDVKPATHPDNGFVQQFFYSGLHGKPGRFRYERTAKGVTVTDRQTGEVHIAQEYKPGKYKIIIDGKARYFQEHHIDSYLKRKQMEALPDHIRKRRNNVEASIFQLSYYTKDGKTRYRGLRPHQLWVRCRSLCVKPRSDSELPQNTRDAPRISGVFLLKTPIPQTLSTFVGRH